MMPAWVNGTTGADDQIPYWSREPQVLLTELRSSTQGLSSIEASSRLKRQGPNIIDEAPATNLARLLLRQFESPLVLILLFGGTLTAVLQEWTEAAIILAVVLGSASLGFFQEYRATTAIAGLRQRLALKVKVVRDGATLNLEARLLVPGDIVKLSAGNLIPADGVMLQALDFLVTEASLTGESFPVEKRPGPVAAEAPMAGRTNTVFMGTSVRSGMATMLVVQTGEHTAYGAIAQRLRTTAPETEFARSLRQFGILLMRVMIVMVLLVLTVNQWLGRPWVESLMFAVALAVGLSPELLPAIVSVTLSAGARKMAQCGVIVRRLEAIENLGSMDVLCTDKTGTLTEGIMTLEAATDPGGAQSAEVLRLGFLNAALETGIENPLDAALVTAGEQAGISVGAVRKIDEIPYDFIRKRLTIFIAPDAGNQYLMITKGAFANVVSICTQVAHTDGSMPLDEPGRRALEAAFQEQSARGFRLLGLARRTVDARSSFSHADENGLCFIGFLRFLDPPKADVKATLKTLAERGIQIKVITGDNRYVSAHVAQSVGLDTKHMLTGEQISAIKDDSLVHQVHKTQLFVEVDPQQKERIVLALKRAGYSVGYLGDGINDAPAMHAADVAISVDQAVDVARESADVVLLRPDLAVLCEGVEYGRRTSINTLKYIGITTSANFGNMISMALVTPLLSFLPLAAKQILLNNFLSDLPSMMISQDRVDASELNRAQHLNVADLRHYMIVFGLTSTVFDLMTFALLLKVFQTTEQQFQSAWFVVSLLTELGVVLILRTRYAAWRSRPSTLLWITSIAVSLISVALLYFEPSATLFGMVPLPLSLLFSVLLIVITYLAATEWVKHRFYARWRPIRAGTRTKRR